MYAIRSYYARGDRLQQEVVSHVFHGLQKALFTTGLAGRGRVVTCCGEILAPDFLVGNVVDQFDSCFETNLQLGRITSYNVCYTKLLR